MLDDVAEAVAALRDDRDRSERYLMEPRVVPRPHSYLGPLTVRVKRGLLRRERTEFIGWRVDMTTSAYQAPAHFHIPLVDDPTVAVAGGKWLGFLAFAEAGLYTWSSRNDEGPLESYTHTAGQIIEEFLRVVKDHLLVIDR